MDHTKLPFSHLPHAYPQSSLRAWLESEDCKGIKLIRMFHKSNTASTAIVSFDNEECARFCLRLFEKRADWRIPVMFARKGNQKGDTLTQQIVQQLDRINQKMEEQAVVQLHIFQQLYKYLVLVQQVLLDHLAAM